MPRSTHFSGELIMKARRDDMSPERWGDIPPLVPEIRQHRPNCRCPLCEREREQNAGVPYYAVPYGHGFLFV